MTNEKKEEKTGNIKNEDTEGDENVRDPKEKEKPEGKTYITQGQSHRDQVTDTSRAKHRTVDFQKERLGNRTMVTTFHGIT